MSDLNLIKPQSVQNIINKFCYTIGMIPTSYKVSLTYEEQIIAIGHYLEETVIPALNNNAEAVAELQNLFIELKNYVDNYFDNLDVQNEVNNKIDKMVQDGTLSQIINQEIFSEINNQITENTNNIKNLQTNVQTNTNNIEILENQKINNLRKKYYSNYTLVNLPQILSDNLFVKRTQVITNEKGNYNLEYNISDFKNTGGTTYYISPNGSNTNDGLTPETAWSHLGKFTQQAQNGDTAILLNGIYTRTQVQLDTKQPCKISCNIIGESENGVWIKASENYDFSQNLQYENVYQTARTNCSAVTNIINKDKGILFNLTKVNTLESCSQTENSYYTDNTIVYVHLYDGIVPNNDNIALCLLLNQPNMFFGEFTQNTKIYIENINFINASNGNIVARNDTEYTCNILLKNCKLYNNNSDNYQYDSFSNIGCFSICDNVHAINSKKDGFNYHAGKNFEARGIELNCVAMNFGEGQTDSNKLSNNASTSHEFSQVLSINGVYGHSNGGCVVDVQSAKRAMYNCKIFDSYGETRKYDILAQSDSIIYLYDCFLKGSNGNPNLMTSGENAYIYYKNTEFDTSSGNVAELI